MVLAMTRPLVIVASSAPEENHSVSQNSLPAAWMCGYAAGFPPYSCVATICVAFHAAELASSAGSKLANENQFCVSGIINLTPVGASAGPRLVPTNVAIVAPV